VAISTVLGVAAHTHQAFPQSIPVPFDDHLRHLFLTEPRLGAGKCFRYIRHLSLAQDQATVPVKNKNFLPLMA